MLELNTDLRFYFFNGKTNMRGGYVNVLKKNILISATSYII